MPGSERRVVEVEHGFRADDAVRLPIFTVAINLIAIARLEQVEQLRNEIVELDDRVGAESRRRDVGGCVIVRAPERTWPAAGPRAGANDRAAARRVVRPRRVHVASSDPSPTPDGSRRWRCARVAFKLRLEIGWAAERARIQVKFRGVCRTRKREEKPGVGRFRGRPLSF